MTCSGGAAYLAARNCVVTRSLTRTISRTTFLAHAREPAGRGLQRITPRRGERENVSPCAPVASATVPDNAVDGAACPHAARAAPNSTAKTRDIMWFTTETCCCVVSHAPGLIGA